MKTIYVTASKNGKEMNEEEIKKSLPELLKDLQEEAKRVQKQETKEEPKVDKTACVCADDSEHILCPVCGSKDTKVAESFGNYYLRCFNCSACINFYAGVSSRMKFVNRLANSGVIGWKNINHPLEMIKKASKKQAYQMFESGCNSALEVHDEIFKRVMDGIMKALDEIDPERLPAITKGTERNFWNRRAADDEGDDDYRS